MLAPRTRAVRKSAARAGLALRLRAAGLYLVGVLCLVCLPQARVAADGLSPLALFLEHGRYIEAEEGLRARLDANDKPARPWLIRLLLETGRYTEARTHAALALQENLAQRADAHTWLAEAFLAEGQLDHAEQALRAALSADSNAVRAEILLGKLLWERGRRAEATQKLQAAASRRVQHAHGDASRRAEALCYSAMAARALGRFQEANNRFREAAELDPERTETQLEWALLFIEKYDVKRAAERVEAALVKNPNNALAQVLYARIATLSASDFVGAQAALQRALNVNPRLSSAYVLQASLALRDMDIAHAEAALERALAINPVDLEALSVRAAARFLDDDPRGFAEQERRVLEHNPQYGHFYSIVSEYAEWEHRYPEIIGMLRRALKIDPQDAAARASLGLGLLRMGDERAGLAELRKAWQRDRYNVQVYNTLNLYDSAIRAHYTDFTSGPFRVRLHKTERAVLAPYLSPLLQRAHAQMRERWGFAPVGPLRVELYSDRAQFSVRTTGLPNLGVQGVSFGKVITGLSPRGGPYNWGQIVWHELCHVFHLQLSKNHVPRWFTEGLAEYETALERPEWKREDDRALWRALHNDSLPPLAAMNRAFTHAESPDEIMTAYFYAYRAVQYLVERFGFGAVRKLLVAFGDGYKLDAAVQHVLDIDLAQLDSEFRADLTRRLSRFDREYSPDENDYADLTRVQKQATRTPRDADALAALAMAEVNAGHYDLAARAARAAIKLGKDNKLAQFALARAALERGETQQAARAVKSLLDAGADGYELRLMAARATLELGKVEQSVKHAQAAATFEPERAEAHQLLLELATKLPDEALAQRALGSLSQLDQHDELLHTTYLALLAKNRAWLDAVREGELALFISPENPAVHLHLGQAYVETGAYERGLAELARALKLGYSQPGLVRLARARAFLLKRQRGSALRELKLALVSDPTLKANARALFTP
jgi:cellulose synthase operon protein C